VVGGAGDHGVDGRGVWQFDKDMINVVVQCKKQSTKVRASALREFEAVASHERSQTLAIFVSRIGFSTDALQYFEQQFKPSAMLAVVSDDETPLLRFVSLNAAARILLPHLTVGIVSQSNNMRYSQLLWRNKIMAP
jgi:hypothetical protein